MNGQAEIVTGMLAYAAPEGGMARGWLISPAAWSQCALLVLACLVTFIASRNLAPTLIPLVTPPAGRDKILDRARGLAHAFLSLLAARILVQKIIRDASLTRLGSYVLIPIAALYALGLPGDVVAWLEAMRAWLGNISFSALVITGGLAAGSLLFWLGRWSSDQPSQYISRQAELRPAKRQLAAKAAEIIIFGAAFLLLINIIGISLTSLAALGGAIGIGLGFGLKKIAANFISVAILLREGRASVGDYMELDRGAAAAVGQMGARAAVLERLGGGWVVVPNRGFIATRVVKHSDPDLASRFEAAFSVSYDAEANKPPALDDPEAPDRDLRALGDSGVERLVGFWASGPEDGKNRSTAHMPFAIRNTLKARHIEIPRPHRAVELCGGRGA